MKWIVFFFKAFLYWLWNILIAVDQLFAAIIGIDPDETLSSFFAKRAKKGYYISILITNFLNFVDPGHSEKYTEHDEGSKSLWVWIKNNIPK